MCHFKRIGRDAWIEAVIRAILFCIFFVTENMSSFVRAIIQPEEFWLYKFPKKSSIVPDEYLFALGIFSTTVVTLMAYGLDKNGTRAIKAFCVPTLAIPLTGVITNIIKLSAGRPRPDFFNRCYGESYMNDTETKIPCTGDIQTVEEGWKSFPSGHASLGFCMLGHVFLYLAYELGTFTARGRGKSWRLILTISPLVFATLISISRLVDYHHHSQDVAVGSILGFVIVHTIYHQYFPSFLEDESFENENAERDKGVSIDLEMMPSDSV